MPKGKKTAASTGRSMSAYECAGCGRIFTSHNKKLASKLAKLHGKKCLAAPKLSVLDTKTIKKHCNTLIKSHNKAFIQDGFHII